MSDPAAHDDDTGRSSGPLRRISLRRIFLGVAIALTAFGAVLRATAPHPESVAAQSARGIAVDTLRVETRPLQPRIEVSGILDARRRVELFAEQDGRVLEIGGEELDRVDQGQLLLRIEALPAEVELARAEATLAQARSELGLARTNLERRKTLATSHVSSKSDLDAAHNAERVAVAVLQAAQASVRNARDRLDKCTLLAPFTGVLRSFPVQAGEYVRPGQRVAELLDLSRVRITIGLRDREVVAIAAGAAALARVEARPGEIFSGQVLRVGAAADPETRKFPVQVEIDNPDERLLPGMVARVSLDLGAQRQAMLIPREAVLDDFNLPFVYVVEPGPEGHPVAQRRRVEVKRVPFQPAELEVSAGISEGEEVAITSLRQLRNGVRLEPRPSLTARGGDAK